MVALDTANGRDSNAIKPARKITGPDTLRAAAGAGAGAGGGGRTMNPAISPAVFNGDGNGGPVPDAVPGAAVAMAVEPSVNGHRDSQASPRLGTNGTVAGTGDDRPTGGQPQPQPQHAGNGSEATSPLIGANGALLAVPSTPAGKVKAKEYGARDLYNDFDIIWTISHVILPPCASPHAHYGMLHSRAYAMLIGACHFGFMWPIHVFRSEDDDILCVRNNFGIPPPLFCCCHLVYPGSLPPTALFACHIVRSAICYPAFRADRRASDGAVTELGL